MKRKRLITAHILPLLVFVGVLMGFNAYAQDDLDINKLIKPVDSAGIFRQDDYYLWCSSVIKGEDGKYHMFYSRWPHGKRPLDDDAMNYIFDGFSGWNKYSEIAYAVSDKIGGPYRYVKTILKGDGDKNKWDRFTMHNPQVRKFGKYYYLYYISNSCDTTMQFNNPKFSKEWKHWLQYNSTQKIGVIKFKTFNDLLNGKYERPARPLMEPDNIHTFEVTTNPTVTQGPDGKYYMMYKSRKPNVGNMTFWMATSDHPDGPYKLASEVFTSADMACEDPCVWYDKKRKLFYAAVKYYSHSGKLVPQFGALALITSQDGLHWHAANHPLISLREIGMSNGKKISLAHLERPFVVTDNDGQPLALFAAASINEPSGGDGVKVQPENNTFNVCFLLGNAK
ncbi:MAG TPA: glycoside hydrolase family protein [Mucilaginibacter sp.]|jgi:hypothetical protein